MQRSQTVFAFLALLLFCMVLLLPSCGGSNANVVVSITVTPSPVSVAYGQVLQLTATAVNSKDNIVGASFTFASSNTSAVSIAPSGALCGGTWDASYVTCSKPTSLVPQSATITVTAQTVTQTVQAYVHEKVDSVAITGGPGIPSSGPICATTTLSTKCICTSLSLVTSSSPSTSLPQFVAKAYSNDATVCSSQNPPATPPCDITADLTAHNTGVSPFQWSSSDATIASVDTTGTSTAGTVTPIGPGQANIFASTAGVNSPAVPFVTCPVNSITLTANGSAGALTISPGATEALSAAVQDTTGATIAYASGNTTSLVLNYPFMNWLSSDLYAVTTAMQTQTVNITSSGVTTSQTVPLSTGTATGDVNGFSSLVASCTPPSCNKNLFPVYSNPLVTTTEGTTTATAFIASAQSETMLVFNVTVDEFLGTYTLPSFPNSFLFNKQGTKAVFGSANGVFVFDPVAVSFSIFPFNGSVLGISPDGTIAVLLGQVAGVNQNAIGVLNLSQNALVTTFPITGKPTDSNQPTVAADFSLDSRYVWVSVTPPPGSTTPNRVYVLTSGVGSTFFTVNSPVNDLAFLASGPLIYLVGDTATTSITARATCLGGQQNVTSIAKVKSPNGNDLPNGVVDVQVGVAPTNIRALPSGAGMLALDPSIPATTTAAAGGIDVITLTNPETPFTGCPPSLPPGLSGTIESVSQQPLGLSSLAPTGNGLNQFLVTPDSSTAVLTDTSAGTAATNTTGSSVIIVSLANLQALTATPIPLANNANLKDLTTGLVFKGDVPGDSSGFVVGGNDGQLHVITAGTDSPFDISGLGLLQADGVTAALPNLVAIRNQ